MRSKLAKKKGKAAKGAAKGRGKVTKASASKAIIVALPPGMVTLRRGPSRPGKQLRMTVSPVLPCMLKNLIANRSDKMILKQHLNAIESHRLRFMDRIAQAEALRLKGNVTEMQGVPAHKAKITEAIGEHETTLLVIQTSGNYALRSGFSAGVGIDQIWYSAVDDTYMLVEAKGPGAVLSTAAAKGDQMSKQWVRNSLHSIVSSPGSSIQDSDDAKRMLFAMDNGPPPKVTGKVIEALPGGGAVERGCPDKGIYHAT